MAVKNTKTNKVQSPKREFNPPRPVKKTKLSQTGQPVRLVQKS